METGSMGHEPSPPGRPSWLGAALVVAALLLLAFVGIFIWLAALAAENPGGEPVKPEPTRPTRPVPPPRGPLAVFKEAWDSEEAAWRLADALAQVSNYAYLAPSAAPAAFHGMGFGKVKPAIAGSQAAYVGIGDGVVVVAFRGTDDVEDWFLNLDFVGKETAHGDIHRGFADAYAMLADQIIPAVRGASTKYVWIAGHSLGGALAVVCAYDFLEAQKIPVTGVVTFGQPMVARKPLADYLGGKLKGRYAHFVNESDVVARVPPTYAHFGSLVWFRDGQVWRSASQTQMFGAQGRSEPTFDENRDLAPLTQAQFEERKQAIRRSRQPRALPNGQLVVEGQVPFLKDHKMDAYLAAIRRQIDSPGEPPPIRADVSVEVRDGDGRIGLQLAKGEVAELKILDPPVGDMLDEIDVRGDLDFRHLGNRRKSETSPDGSPLIGGGWRCVYVQVNQAGRLKLSYKRGAVRFETEVRVTFARR